MFLLLNIQENCALLIHVFNPACLILTSSRDVRRLRTTEERGEEVADDDELVLHLSKKWTVLPLVGEPQTASEWDLVMSVVISRHFDISR